MKARRSDPVASPMSLRAPGWYPDPAETSAGGRRWWTGTEWGGTAGETGAPAARVAGPAVVASVEQRLATARRDATWAPLGLAVTSVIGIALIPVFHTIGVAFLTLALASVLLGVKALGLRLRGLAIPVVPPLLGVLVGSASGLVLGALLVLHFVARMR